MLKKLIRNSRDLFARRFHAAACEWPQASWGCAAAGDLAVIEEPFSISRQNASAALVLRLVELGTPCTWLCAGEHPDDAVTRLVALMTGLDAERLRSHVLAGAWHHVERALRRLQAADLVVEYLATSHESVVRQVYEAKGCVVVDRLENAELAPMIASELLWCARRRGAVSIVIGDDDLTRRLAAMAQVHVCDGVVVRAAPEAEDVLGEEEFPSDDDAEDNDYVALAPERQPETLPLFPEPENR